MILSLQKHVPQRDASLRGIAILSVVKSNSYATIFYSIKEND